MIPQPIFQLPPTKTINLPADTISPSLDFEIPSGDQFINRLLALLCLSLFSGLVLLCMVLLRYRVRIAAAAYWNRPLIKEASKLDRLHSLLNKTRSKSLARHFGHSSHGRAKFSAYVHHERAGLRAKISKLQQTDADYRARLSAGRKDRQKIRHELITLQVLNQALEDKVAELLIIKGHNDSVDGMLPLQTLSPPVSTSVAVNTDANSGYSDIGPETMSLSSSLIAAPDTGSVNNRLRPRALSAPAISFQAPVISIDSDVSPIEPETTSSDDVSIVPLNIGTTNDALPLSTIPGPASSSEAPVTTSDGSISPIETEKPSPSGSLNPAARTFQVKGMSDSRWAPSPASSSDATASHYDTTNDDDDDGDAAPQQRKRAHRKRAVRKSQQLVRDERLMAGGEQPVNPRNIGPINERRWANGRPPLAPPMWR